MRNRLVKLPGFLVAAVMLFSRPGLPFEPATHAKISNEAYGAAKLQQRLFENLGIPATQGLSRRLFVGEERHIAVDWISEGSKDEDFGLRPVHHFYDPIYNRGLTAGGSPLGEKAYEWALEDQEEVNGQGYSYRHAKEAYLKALTSENAGDREHWLATTFYTLGRVIHVLQDMASPAHVRNAKHVGTQGLIDLGPKSVVELHLDRVRGELVYDGFAVPKTAFTRLRDLWVETDAAGAPVSGPSAKGLSQVINRNFVSEGTNFTAFQNGNHAVEYALPVLDTSRCRDDMVDTIDVDAQPVRGPVTFCANSFVDPLTGNLETNPHMTTFSLFGRDLAERGVPLDGVFSLNAMNAESIGRLTIPRAVGYSAALVEYFFRGTLDFELGPCDWDFSQLCLSIWNTSAEQMTGAFALYTEDRTGRRSPVRGAAVDGVTLDGVAPGSIGSIYSLVFTPDDDLKLGGLVLVFTGTLGAEAGAVVGKVKPWEPEIFIVQEQATLTGPEQMETRMPCVEIDTGRLCNFGWETASMTRRQDPTFQRLAGRFLASEVPLADGVIHRIAVGAGARLRLNGIEVGTEWSREAGPPLVPQTWEVTRTGRGEWMTVETTSGRSYRGPFVTWERQESQGTSTVFYDYDIPGCSLATWVKLASMSSGVTAEAAFGPEFLPVGTVAGYPVGTSASEGALPWGERACAPEGTWTARGYSVFASGSRVVSIGAGQLSRRLVDANEVGLPPETPVAGPLLHGLTFRRQYSPEELVWYRLRDVTPPVYDVRLD